MDPEANSWTRHLDDLRRLLLTAMTTEKQSEAELVEAFRAWLRKQSGVVSVHGEVSDWDLVVVANGTAVRNIKFFDRNLPIPAGSPGAGDHASLGSLSTDLYQVGIHAKLKPNLQVLCQAVLGNGPQLRCVLVPEWKADFAAVARGLGLSVATSGISSRFRNKGFMPWVEGFNVEPPRVNPSNHGIWPGKPMWLPPIETDRPAGVPSPSTLTRWRVGALKLVNLATSQGYLTSKDFKDLKVDPRRWVDSRWIVDSGEKSEGLKKYHLGAGHPGIGWEKEAAAIAAQTTENTKETP